MRLFFAEYHSLPELDQMIANRRRAKGLRE
jgi:hypothetical protein